MYNYAFATGALIIFPVWLYIFTKRKDLRKSMIIIGTYIAVLGIIFDFSWFLKDYWYPLKYISTFNFIWQEFIFGFLLGGIISAAYEFIFIKKLKIGQFNIRNFLISLFTLIFSHLIFTNIFKINSIYSNIIGILIGLGIILYFRRDLLVNALISGLCSFFIVIGGYLILLNIYPNLIKDWWMIQNISGIFIWKIPIEEIIWFTSFGLTAGPLYKFWHTA